VVDVRLAGDSAGKAWEWDNPGMQTRCQLEFDVFYLMEWLIVRYFERGLRTEFAVQTGECVTNFEPKDIIWDKISLQPKSEFSRQNTCSKRLNIKFQTPGEMNVSKADAHVSNYYTRF